MSGFQIRRMHPDEAEIVATMLARVIASLDFYNAEARTTEIELYTATYLRTQVQQDPDAVLVAEHDTAIVGFCVSRYDDGPYWLSWFGTQVGYTGRGVGTALLEALHAARRTAGGHKIWCDSRTDNHVSRACLKRVGYRELCTIVDHWYRQDYVLLEYRLDRPAHG